MQECMMVEGSRCSLTSQHKMLGIYNKIVDNKIKRKTEKLLHKITETRMTASVLKQDPNT